MNGYVVSRFASTSPSSTSTTPSSSSRPVLPHHKLLAYVAARDLVVAVRAANVRDAHLPDQALRAAKSAALNCAEGAARVTRADKARAFAIARGEAVEGAAAVEIAALAGDATEASALAVARVADRVVALLTPLVRAGGAGR